jgi:O-antigen/teichoic acid export membrane protein
MEQRSVKINFTLNLINTFVGLLYPIVTFPYISRILMPEGLGLIQFLQSVISYFAMFAAIGIPLYAVKEVAKVRDDVSLRSKTVSEIFCLHALLTISVYFFLLLTGLLVNQLAVHFELYLVLSCHLFLNVLGCEWFYQGIEDFKYITIRSLIVRLISLIALFVFVRSVADIYIYAFLLIMAEAGNYLFNFIHLRKYVHLFSSKLKELNIRRHVKPALEIFLLNVIVSIYINLDSVMLGFMKDNTHVGYYTAATQIVRALCGFSVALGAVVLPRLANYFHAHELSQFKKLAKDTLSFSMVVMIPLCVMLMITAPVLVPVFCGSAYGPTIQTIRVLSPIMVFLGISGILGTKVLYAMDCQRIVILCTVFGAVSNFILNLFLIPLFSHYGAALASLVAEFLVSASMLYFGYKLMRLSIFDRNMFEIVIGTIVVAIFVLFFNRHFQLTPLVKLVSDLLIGGVCYTSLMVTMKNEYFRRALVFVAQQLKTIRQS